MPSSGYTAFYNFQAFIKPERTVQNKESTFKALDFIITDPH